MRSRSDKVVISFYNGRGNYTNAAMRLLDSLYDFPDIADVQIFGGEETIGAPKHEDNPYAFKIYAFEAALRMGYQKILYLDSSVYAVRDYTRAFDLIEEDGYLMQESGHNVGQWCNDVTLQYWGLTREEASTMPMYGNAGMLGLDFRDSTARDFFRRWRKCMEDGMFKGSWDDHRHDMTNGSIIANAYRMKYQPGDQILQYAAPEDPLQNDTIIFKAQGI
jgi:hypothetical protein